MGRAYPKALKQLICGIDVTAFAAVLLALVAMFMVRTQPDVREHISVDFAKVSHPRLMQAADREDALEIAVTRDGQVYFGLDRIMIDQLPAKIRERLNQGAERKVYIRADARGKFGWVKQILDRVHSAGIENVAFLVDGSQVDPFQGEERLPELQLDQLRSDSRPADSTSSRHLRPTQ
jgi:biopolymer transport protein TolR